MLARWRAAWERKAGERREGGSVSTSVNDSLRQIMDRHGAALLNDNRRCESCLRDGGFSGREMAGLVAALKAGVPKRLTAIPAGTLTAKGVSSFAAELSDQSGLSDAVARSSVEAWAYALRVDGSAEAKLEKIEDKKLEDKKAGKTVAPAAEPKKPSLIEAILGVMALIVLVIVVGSLPANQMELTLPGWFLAFVVFVKSGQAVFNYVEWQVKKRRANGVNT